MFVALHFDEFGLKSTSELVISELYRALGDETLCLRDECSLVDLIAALCLTNREYCSLFRYVHLEYVDLPRRDVYLEHAYPGHIAEGIWSSICRCLSGQFGSKCFPLLMREKRFRRHIETCLFAEVSPFNGNISHLR